MTMQTNYAAIAACISEPGQKHYREVQERMLATLSGEGPKLRASRADLAANRRAMAAAIRGR